MIILTVNWSLSLEGESIEMFIHGIISLQFLPVVSMSFCE